MQNSRPFTLFSVYDLSNLDPGSVTSITLEQGYVFDYLSNYNGILQRTKHHQAQEETVLYGLNHPISIDRKFRQMDRPMLLLSKTPAYPLNDETKNELIDKARASGGEEHARNLQLWISTFTQNIAGENACVDWSYPPPPPPEAPHVWPLWPPRRVWNLLRYWRKEHHDLRS